MMGLMEKFREWANGGDEYDDEEFEEFNTAPQAETQQRVVHTATTYDQPNVSQYGRSNKVVNISATTQLQVVLVKPDKFESASEIADHLKERRTVVVNLEQTNKEIARRLLDFLSGVAYAYQGKIQKIANFTFLITPYNVGIMGDIIDELESNGLYF